MPQEGLEPPQAVPKTAVLSITLSGQKLQASNRDWTDDLILTKDVLYQLSYASKTPLEGVEPPLTL